jgi:serine/threonine protein kinase
MATASEWKQDEQAASGLLSKLQQAHILSSRMVEQIRAKVQSGDYPGDPLALSKHLIKKEILTEYQARRLLYGQIEGLVVGRYVIIDRLGKGAMGKVYKARHRLMDRTVALKIISREYLARSNALPRFLREMRLVGRLDHPNIVRALDADELGGTPYIVMEYVPGQDLERKLLDQGPLSPTKVVRYATQVALGLDHAHRRGVIHRDIKPSNLLLGEDRRVRILDLGLGALIDMGDSERGSFATTDGLGVGTIEYISPEGAAGRPDVDGRGDLYSLGCVMYHLITGRVPFPADSKVESLARRIRELPEPIETLRPGVPDGLSAVLKRLLANHPEDRFQTASEAAEAFQSLASCWQHPLTEVRSSITPVAAVEPSSASGPVSPVAEPSSPSDPSRILSSGLIPVPRPSSWVRVLVYLSEQPPARVLLVALAIVLTAFFAGFALASSLR